MSRNQYLVVSGLLFSFVAVAHLLRIIFRIPIHVDLYAVPMLFSWIGLIVAGALAFSAFRLKREEGDG